MGPRGAPSFSGFTLFQLRLGVPVRAEHEVADPDHVFSRARPPQPTCSMVCSTKVSPLRAQCELEKELILYPRHFGPNMKDQLTNKLIAKARGPRPRTYHRERSTDSLHGLPSQVEGTCSGRHGFIITVTEVLEHGKGKIREGTLQYVSVSALLDAQAFLAEACGWRHLPNLRSSASPTDPGGHGETSPTLMVSTRLRSQGATEEYAQPACDS